MRLSGFVFRQEPRFETNPGLSNEVSYCPLKAGCRKVRRSVPIFVLCLIVASCSSSPKRPCSEGGQAAHDPGTGPIPFQGTKKCFQKPDESGVWVNDGKYFEWYPSEKIAVTGEYKMGKKSGRWAEYDENGKKVSDRYFENGKEVPAP